MRISDWSSDVCSSDLLLVVTFYTPHNHHIGFLRTQAERLDARLTYVWPTENRKQRAMFEKLTEAYRSEERRVGKERVSTCRSRWSSNHQKKKTTKTHYKYSP